MSSAAVVPSAKTTKPAHVPDTLVYDFDYYADQGFVADPHLRLLELLRTAPPIFWTPRRGGLWVMLSYAANHAAARDWESFSSEMIPQAQIKAILASMPPGTPHVPQPIPINVDPPDHTKYRTLLLSAFSPKAMNALKDSIRALAAELIEAVRPAGRCELMSAVAEPLPVQVFLKMLGLPLDRVTEYRELVREQMANVDLEVAVDMEAAMATVARMQRVVGMMKDTMIERREHPRDDLISMLWQSKVDGDNITMEDMENFGILLFVAGLDTVMNAIGFGIRHLAGDPETQDRLRRDPTLIPEAVEEILRRYSFAAPVRRVAKDIVFQDVEMKAGDRVWLCLPAADLDSKEFEDPQRFDLDRAKKTHIAFNAGPHRCVGSHLARTELAILYEEILSRLPQFRLDTAHPPKLHAGPVMGVDSLHLVW